MAHEPTPARTHESAAPARVSAETLFRVHGSFVATFLRRLGAAADEIDDIVQDVFVVVHRRGGFVPGAAHPKTWLAEIGLRRFSSVRRTAKRRRTAPVPGEFFAAIPAKQACPFDAAASAQGLRRVQRAIDEMDLVQRTVFILFEIEGDSCDSIAAAMRVPVGTIHSRLHAARRSFRNAYTRLDQEAAESRIGEPLRLQDDPSLPQEGRLGIARFAAVAYPTFDVAHGLARFRASAHAPPSAPPHAFAGGAGAHPCAIAVSLAAHLGLGLSAVAWVTPPPPVVPAEMQPVAVSLEDDVSDVAAPSDGRDTSQTGRTSAGRSGLLSHRPSAPRHSPAAGRAGDDQAKEVRKARPRQGEPSLNWAIQLPDDVGEASGGEGVDGADRVNAKGAGGTARAVREEQHGSGQNAAPSLGSGSMGRPTGGEPSPRVSGNVEPGDDRGHGAQLLPAWDCEFPSWAKVGGVVRMIATVRADGTAADAEIISDPGHGFAAVARECAMRQRFVAALDEHGKPTLGKTGPFNVRFVRH